MQSENVSLTLEKELVTSQSFDKLESKDQDSQSDDQDIKSSVKKTRKTTKVKVATRLCIFE
ncbi:hypothetical protein A9Q77_04860 [Marinomonas sp. 42_23_T18]|nr:hypothetical protein A9Q77_04860 [Marinomonas sp. 42_23_T18]